MKNYQAIKEGDSFTIAQWDKGYQACIINDGIYGYYWWSTCEQAQAAADAYNAYDGLEWLDSHSTGADLIYLDDTNEYDADMLALYCLFNAVREGSAYGE